MITLSISVFIFALPMVFVCCFNRTFGLKVNVDDKTKE